MATRDFLIRWDINWEPPITEVENTFRNIDERIFHDRAWMTSFWRKTVGEISKSVADKFTRKAGWPPLSAGYVEWKTRAVERGYKIQAGAFGKKRARYAEMGRLTGTLYLSATKPKRFANIWGIQDGPEFEAASFQYSIDLTRLPYAKIFHDKRAFFYLEATEWMGILKELQKKLIFKLRKLGVR